MKFNYFNQAKKGFGAASIGRGITGGISTLSPRFSSYIGKKLLMKPHGVRQYEFSKTQPTKEINLYTSLGKVHVNLFGHSNKLVLVSHGWGDTSACFDSIIEALLAQGFMVAAIDHIGHGKSAGNKSHLPSFIESLDILLEQLNEDKVDVVAIIAHSMGAIATLNLPTYLLENKKIILVSSPIKFFELMFEKVEQFGISKKLLSNVISNISQDYGTSLSQLTTENHRSKLALDITFIHDNQDRYAPFDDLSQFLSQEKNTLIATQGLGHRKILSDTSVINHITQVLAAE